MVTENCVLIYCYGLCWRYTISPSLVIILNVLIHFISLGAGTILCFVGVSR